MQDGSPAAAPSDTNAQIICRGLHSEEVSHYESVDPGYLLKHWDKFRGEWRSKTCALFVAAEPDTCENCRNEKSLLCENHPVLFLDSSNSQRESKSSFRWHRLHTTFVFALTILSGYLHYAHVSVLHENHVHFSHLSTLERELYFRTEMGFYYSYFKQMIEAPTFQHGFSALLSDNLTEYPTTINALSRFNLYPEIVLSAAYRGYVKVMKIRGVPTKQCFRINRGNGAPSVTSCEGLGEPPYFYVEGVFWLAGFMMTGFFLLAYYSSGGVAASGVLAVAAYFFNHKECTRVMWTPPLRESFSMPFFVWQQLALLHALKEPHSVMRLFLFAVLTVLFMLPWQFAQFVLLLQACALFGCYVFGSLDSASLRLLLLPILAAVITSSALQFGNAMLITGILPAGVLSMLALSFSKLNCVRLGFRIVLAGFLLVGLTLCVKHGLALLSGTTGDDDSHVFDLLRAKFDPVFQTFDTKLYLCSPEFRFYKISSLAGLSKTLVFPTAVAVAVIFICRVTSKPLVQMPAPVTFMLLQVAAFGVLAGLISRLKVLFTPQLILTASLLFHERLCPASITYRHVLAVVLIAGMAICGIPNVRHERSVVGEYSNYQLEQVVDWILENTEPSDSFAGPMTIMATVRETAFRPIYNHPHYENAGLRNRTRHAYSLYSRKPLDEIWRIHKLQIGTKYVIGERMLCFSRKTEGCRYRDMWDVEDPANAGSEPVCEALFDQGGWEPYFRKVFENQEFSILEVMDPAKGALSSRPDDVCEPKMSCSSIETRKYLLYKVQSGEGFNLQRNVFMRVAQMMANFLDAQNFTLVVPPFANSIHWSDRSIHPFGTFFDVEILREALDVIELEEFLSLRGSVDTVVHLSLKNDLTDPEVITRYDKQAGCTPESVTSQNSGWHNEFQLRSFEAESHATPYEGSMLGYTFPVHNLVCLKVRFDLRGRQLASALSDVFANASSVLFDNAQRLSWDIVQGEGEGSPGYYSLMAKMRYRRRVHDAAIDFLESRNINHDFAAVHMRRKDFLDVRPDVPAPAEVGLQLAVVVRNLAMNQTQTSTSLPQRFPVFVATDSTDRANDIVEIRESLNAPLQRPGGVRAIADVTFFDGRDSGLEEGEVALVDQIICTSATHFVGSNTSYFTKAVFEERLLLGKSLSSTYSVLCKSGTNDNSRCQADLLSCLSCMNSWQPKLSEQLERLLSSAAIRNQRGLHDRYQRVPLVGMPSSDETEHDASKVSTHICFVVMSQYGSPKDEKAGERLGSQLRDDGHAVFVLQSELPAEARGHGHWAFLPLLDILFNSGCQGDGGTRMAVSWYVFLSPNSQVDTDAMYEAIGPLDESQPLFVGHALRDSTTSICHHYSSDFEFKYPSLDSGFAFTHSLLQQVAKSSLSGSSNFHIDPEYEFAKHIRDAFGFSLTDIQLPVIQTKAADGRSELVQPCTISIGVKTTLDNHATRVPVIKRMWTDAAEKSGARVVFFSETRDDSIPTVNEGIVNSEKIKGEARKLKTMLQHAADVFGRNRDNEQTTGFRWLLITDDDTLLNFNELRSVLSDYDPSAPLLIGDRYRYSYSGQGRTQGYDYLTGGAGFVLSAPALYMIVDANQEAGHHACRMATVEPDDMWLGRCAQSLLIPLVDEPGFHQARPRDYNAETLALHRHVSFHRFNDLEEAKEISRVYLTL